jgi:RimJ/RimL family protein N-acetyltransferase
MKNSFILGENIYLRNLTLEDADGSYPQWFNDPEVCRYNSHYKFPYTKQKALDYIQYATESKNALILAVVHKKNDCHIGNISLQQIDLFNRNAEFAIIIGDKGFWKKGLAYEAAILLISHGFIELNLHRIYCGTSGKNIEMRKLAEKIGMKEEGRRREAILYEGSLVDVIEYGILQNEFLID